MKTLLEIDISKEPNILQDMEFKKPKNIHLTEGGIKALSIRAIENGTNFKNYVEDLLEGIAANRLRLSAKAEKKKKKNGA